MYVAKGRDGSFSVEAEMQRDHSHESPGENAGGKLVVTAGLEGGDVPHRDFRHRRELFPTHVA
jgi:hypothetical protein